MNIRHIAMAPVTLLLVLGAAPLRAQTAETPEVRLARTQVEGIPVGATVKLRTRGGERLKSVLFGSDEAGITVKPATRIPEPSRRIAYSEIDDIERRQDRVSVGKYVGAGAAFGGVALILLLVGGI